MDAAKLTATMRLHMSHVVLGAVAVFALSGLLALPVVAQQTNSSDAGSGQSSPSSSSSTQSKQQSQPAPPAHKNAAQENPFPADVSKQAAQQPSQPTDAPAAPDAEPAAQPAHKTAAQENPFPEDVSKGAAAAAAKDSDANSSSSSSSSSSAGGDADPNADVPRETGRRRLKKPNDKDIQSGSLAGEGRAQDDVRVGRFYLGNGEFTGAYGRYSEAVRLDPANVDAIYGLAAAAAGLHYTDEALANYRLYLQVAPDGNDAKAARKALRALSK